MSSGFEKAYKRQASVIIYAAWILVSAIVLLIIIALIMMKPSKKEKKTDYYMFFITGIMWVLVGLIPGNSVFFIMGLAFMGIGLLHKDKWKQNHRAWKELSQKERRIKLWITAAAAIILAAAIAYLLARR